MTKEEIKSYLKAVRESLELLFESVSPYKNTYPYEYMLTLKNALDMLEVALIQNCELRSENELLKKEVEDTNKAAQIQLVFQQEIIERKRETLDILKPYISVHREISGKCFVFLLYIFREITEEQYELLKEWKEND